MEERLQKILARAGFGARRPCEELISRGRVTVNGQTATLGQKADPARDRISVDGKPIRLPPQHVYVALHKPRGVLSVTSDDRGRQTVRDLVALPGHLFPVGRLDYTSEGLIILTDDGDLANQLTHPRYEHAKEYLLYIQGRPGEDVLEHWRKGVFLDGRDTAPAEVSVFRQGEANAVLRVVLREGRNRQLRKVAEMLGLSVDRLVRVRIGPIELGDLRPGAWRHLTAVEIGRLRQATGKPDTSGLARKRR